MKICIYGAGAIGGYLGVELALAGEEVTLIARGPHLAAMREHGLALLIGGERKVARVACTDDPGDVGPQDYVFLTLKAHAIAGIASRVVPLLGPETAIVTAQNGVPWWYFHKLAGPWEGRRIESVDAGGTISDALPPERAIGCIVYPSCEVVEPGVIQHVAGKRFMLGEPDGSLSARVVALSETLARAGFKAPVRRRIRDDLWLKLWGNVSFNPVSVLTGGTLAEIGTDPGARGVVRAIMLEAQAVGEKLGGRFAVDVETRIGWGTSVGAHKTSMLQDFERGRPMEIDALVGVVSELGGLVGVPTPTIDLVLALIRLSAGVRSRAVQGRLP